MAANTIARQSFGFRDAKGNTARMNFYIYYDAAEATPAAAVVGSGLSSAVFNLSNAAFGGAYGPYGQIVVAAYGTNSTFASVEDKAMLTFQAADGSLHRFNVPAPKSAIFLSDAETVNPANALVLALQTALHASSVSAAPSTRGGVLFGATSFVGGIRQRRKTRRRINIYTLSAGLDEPAE